LRLWIIYRTRSFEQVPTVSTLHIKGIPDYLVVLELDIGIEDGTTTDTLVGWTYIAEVRGLNWWDVLAIFQQPK